MRYLLRLRRDIHNMRDTISTVQCESGHDTDRKSDASPMLPKLANTYREMLYEWRNLSVDRQVIGPR